MASRVPRPPQVDAQATAVAAAKAAKAEAAHGATEAPEEEDNDLYEVTAAFAVLVQTKL